MYRIPLSPPFASLPDVYEQHSDLRHANMSAQLVKLQRNQAACGDNCEIFRPPLVPMFSSASDRLLIGVLALKDVHGKKATHGCLSSVAISIKFAGIVSVTRRGTPSMLL
jgi:hypothetical protein